MANAVELESVQYDTIYNETQQQQHQEKDVLEQSPQNKHSLSSLPDLQIPDNVQSAAAVADAVSEYIFGTLERQNSVQRSDVLGVDSNTPYTKEMLNVLYSPKVSGAKKKKPSSILTTGKEYVKRHFTGGPADLGKECTYSDIELALGKSYVDASNTHFSSNALDVLALYIKGQKLLYTEAKTYCEQQLNFLMLPAIFISCVGSIFSFLSDRYVDGPIIIASLNGFNAFLLALISYLKLDAKAQAHKTSAYKFDKLESMCEFNSGKFMFFANTDNQIMDVLGKIETEVKEIKETNQFILPETIRYEFSFTYSTNIFMLVKKIQSTEMVEMHSLKNCVNYINTLNRQISTMIKQNHIPDDIQKLMDALRAEEIRKNKFVENILECRKRYFDLDDEFNREIEKHIRRSNRSFLFRILFCDWLKS